MFSALDLLENTDPEDIADIIPQVEQSFGISFLQDELAAVITFGDFCSLVVTKIRGESAPDCTTQQAFYKLRTILQELVSATSLTPDSTLADILPTSRIQRQLIAQQMQAKLGFSIKLTELSENKVLIFVFGGSLAIVGSFWFGGLAAVITIFAVLIANKLAFTLANQLKFSALRDIVNMMVRKNYLQSRRDAKTINRAEIIPTITALFSQNLSLAESALKPEAKFG